jgi:hypothetical protein
MWVGDIGSGLRAKSSRGEYLLYEDTPVRALKPGYGGGVYGITVDKKRCNV